MKKIKDLIEKYKIFIGVGIFSLSVFILGYALFSSNFNLVKILITLTILVIIGGITFLLYFTKEPKEEKLDLFKILQNLLDSISEGIVIYDKENKIIFVNKSFCELVNLDRNFLLNFKVEEWQVQNKDYEMLANIFFPFLKGDDLQILSQNPEIVKVTFRSPGLKYLLITYLDVLLDKKYKLRVILDKTEDILETQRQTEFVQLVSHHLLTPLNELRWQLEAIDKEKIDEENRIYLENSIKVLKNAIILSTAVLSMVKLESGKMEISVEEVDFEELVVFILDLLKPSIDDKKVKVIVELQEKYKKLPGDKNLLTLAFFSIIENSILYNKIGGEVRIRLSKIQGRPYVNIEIEDTGIGLSKEDIKNLFRKYYRGKGAKSVKPQGFGIGLYNAKNIIELHGGEIKIESEEGKGTKVTVVLPIDSSLISVKRL